MAVVSSEKEKQKAKQTVEVLARACQHYEQLVKKVSRMTKLEPFDILYDMGKYQMVVDGQQTLDEAIKHNGRKLVVEFLLQQGDEETVSVKVGENITKVSEFDRNLAPFLPDIEKISNVGSIYGKSFGVPSQASRYSEKLRSMPVRYNIGKPLGKGTLGAVFRADEKKGGTFAVKIIPKNGRHLPQEADINFLKQLKHCRIVEYKYIIEPAESNDIHILMEYMYLGSLKEFLERNGALDEELVMAYTKQILEGLDFLHSKNIIHQDLKPANLLIGNTHDERIIKIADFGSSKFAYLKTKAGQQGRTPKYTDPGVSIGREIAGRRSDIWSLGVIVIEMYTGNYPWDIEGEHPITVPHILEESPPRIVIPDEVPNDALIEMAQKMLLPVSDRPYASVLLQSPVFLDELEDDLDEFF